MNPVERDRVRKEVCKKEVSLRLRSKAQVELHQSGQSWGYFSSAGFLDPCAKERLLPQTYVQRPHWHGQRPAGFLLKEQLEAPARCAMASGRQAFLDRDPASYLPAPGFLDSKWSGGTRSMPTLKLDKIGASLPNYDRGSIFHKEDARKWRHSEVP